MAIDRVGDARRRRGGGDFLMIFGMVLQTGGAINSAGPWVIGAPVNALGMLFFGLGGVSMGDSIRRSNDGRDMLNMEDYNSVFRQRGRIYNGLSFAAQGVALLVSAIPHMADDEFWVVSDEWSLIGGFIAGGISFVPSVLAYVWLRVAATEALEELRSETKARRFSNRAPFRQSIQLFPSVSLSEDATTVTLVGRW